MSFPKWFPFWDANDWIILLNHSEDIASKSIQTELLICERKWIKIYRLITIIYTRLELFCIRLNTYFDGLECIQKDQQRFPWLIVYNNWRFSFLKHSSTHGGSNPHSRIFTHVWVFTHFWIFLAIDFVFALIHSAKLSKYRF